MQGSHEAPVWKGLGHWQLWQTVFTQSGSESILTQDTIVRSAFILYVVEIPTSPSSAAVRPSCGYARCRNDVFLKYYTANSSLGILRTSDREQTLPERTRLSHRRKRWVPYRRWRKYPEMGPEQAISQMQMKVAFLDVGGYGDHSENWDNTGPD